ncbi:MAG TPA: SRPBCC family protein [Holophagaceae bacterium]|nr:SRPBCC family protein [Holophagaceae bacterium]
MRLETFIRAPRDRAFDLARDLDFHQRSLAHTGERVVGGRLTGLIEPGEEVEWEARHLGFRWRLRSRITAMPPPASFTDEQVRGPFRSFRHQHRFESVPGGTLMVDEWVHVAPLGLLGRIADRLFLDRHVRRLLETRNGVLSLEAELPSAS